MAKTKYKDLPKSKGILDDFSVRKNVATRAGTITKVPVDDIDIVNKKFLDDNYYDGSEFTAGSVLFSDGTNITEDNFNLYWNDATNELQPHLLKITSDGTQAAPALKFNDTNTGFFKSGDSVRFSLNNDTKLTIDSTGLEVNGNIGFTATEYISTDAVGYTDIHSAVDKGVRLHTGDSVITFGDVGLGSNYMLLTTPAAYFYYHIGGAYRMIWYSTKWLMLGNMKQNDNLGLELGSGSGFGTAGDSKIYYNGADLILDPDVIGTGKVLIGTTGDDDIVFTNGEVKGDLFFTGTGSGLPFAEIYARDNTTTTSTSTTKAQILIFDTNGQSNNMTPDHAQDHITVVKAGKYKIDTSISIKNSSGAAHVISVEMWKNNGNTVFNNIHAGRTFSTGSDVGNMTMSGIVDLAANDTIEMWITSDSASARTVTVEDVDFSAIQIGGT